MLKNAYLAIFAMINLSKYKTNDTKLHKATCQTALYHLISCLVHFVSIVYSCEGEEYVEAEIEQEKPEETERKTEEKDGKKDEENKPPAIPMLRIVVFLLKG